MADGQTEDAEMQAEEFLQDPDAEETETDIHEQNADDGDADITSKKRPSDEPAGSQAKRTRVEEEKPTEDACFVCHDGGELHICEKGNCPKVYHAECVGLQENAFDEGTWYCGWHYCVDCNKAAPYHCVTCSTAYCPTHVKASEFTVLKKKEKLGLCSQCMPQVREIEREDAAEATDIDTNTEEFLFREYWLHQRTKLGLSLPDASQTGAGRLSVPSASEGTEEGSVDQDEAATEDENSLTSPAPIEKRSFASWGSPELLAFLTSCNHDVSKPLRRDAVSSLVWDYVHDKKLLNPKKRGEVLCDAALEKLFKRKTVGRFELNRILQEQFSGSHTRRGAGGKRLAQQHGKGAEKKVTVARTKRLNRSESNKKKKAAGAKEASDAPAAEEWAAVSRKNIELLYLRRSLLEILMDSSDFERIVLGGFVRIRTQAIDNPAKAAYRLVPVIGVKEGAEYALGHKTTTKLLTVQNLSKTEDSAMDTLSSQDFDEDEIARLWRATKVAEVFKPLTVAQVEAKAKEILPFKVDEAMEAEKQKLVNLRDRASELGEMKELKRIVEQLKELDKPDARQKRIDALLKVEVDPRMNPEVVYDPEAEEQEKKEKEAQQKKAEQQKALPSPRNRYEDRNRNGGRGGGNQARNEPRSDRERGPEQRRPRERSRERDRGGRRSPFRPPPPRDRERESPRGGDDRRRDRPRSSRFDEMPSRGLDARSPRFGGERPSSRERGGRDERGFPGGVSSTGLSPRGPVLRDARDLQLQQNAPPASFSTVVRPPPQFGNFGTSDVSKGRPQFEERPREYGKFEAPPPKFEPRPSAPPQQNFRGPVLTYAHNTAPQMTSELNIETRTSAAVRPQFRSRQTPPIAPLPLPLTVPQQPVMVQAPPAAVPVVQYTPPADPKWHYRDPQGTQQGPFTISQLKKWQATGAFPADLKVWMEGRPENSALVLTSLLASAANTQAEPQRPAPQQERTTRWEQPDRSQTQAAFSAPARAPENVAFSAPARAPENIPQAQSYREASTLASGGYQRPSDQGGRSTPPSSGNFGNPQSFPQENERWKGNKIDFGRNQFDTAGHRPGDLSAGVNLVQQYPGQGLLQRPFDGRSDTRPRSRQTFSSGGQQRPKVNKPCTYFASGYCVKGDSCDYLHQR